MYIWNAPEKLDIKLTYLIYELRTYMTPHPAIKFITVTMP